MSATGCHVKHGAASAQVILADSCLKTVLGHRWVNVEPTLDNHGAMPGQAILFSQKRDLIIGMTGRAFLLLLAKFHNKNITFIIETLLNNDYPLITDHRLGHNHEFDWTSVKILDTERFLNKRLTSKMLFIKLQNNSLNLQLDTECLNHAYVDILNEF
ncbi:hypothetical protein ALC57_14236 [Trachymyrmex cornetzi]|uniref:Helix-turn-helix domain-containing protein n=1 Tax=Trachymyrmex cornetzi TaxID=471704 RepID=A0A195DL07_9HYME|nr:hypothetical protein ALC57_14236 [Trachymyrmex cornetzi]